MKRQSFTHGGQRHLLLEVRMSGRLKGLELRHEMEPRNSLRGIGFSTRKGSR